MAKICLSLKVDHMNTNFEDLKVEEKFFLSNNPNQIFQKYSDCENQSNALDISSGCRYRFSNDNPVVRL